MGSRRYPRCDLARARRKAQDARKLLSDPEQPPRAKNAAKAEKWLEDGLKSHSRIVPRNISRRTKKLAQRDAPRADGRPRLILYNWTNATCGRQARCNTNPARASIVRERRRCGWFVGLAQRAKASCGCLIKSLCADKPPGSSRVFLFRLAREVPPPVSRAQGNRTLANRPLEPILWALGNWFPIADAYRVGFCGGERWGGDESQKLHRSSTPAVEAKRSPAQRLSRLGDRKSSQKYVSAKQNSGG
jgi:hypothetical protein